MFFSDIHGVPETLERFFEHSAAFAPDRLVLLGDALYHGPRNGVPERYDTKRVAELLNAHKREILAVRGNCDSEVDQMLLEFPIMADFSEILTDTRRFFLTHGHLWNEANPPQVPPGTVLVQGHTHIPELRELACGLTLFNPGSLSLPKSNFPQSFGFFDGTDLSVRRLDDGTKLM
jgi:putative phosphoesterase